MKTGSQLIAALLFLVFSTAQSARRPDHLEPIEPYDLYTDGYRQITFDSLIGWDSTARQIELFMLVFPSFRPEYAVVIRRTSSVAEYKLEYSAFREPLWKWRTADSSKMEPDLRRVIGIDRKNRALPDSVVSVISLLWKNILEDTRYSRTVFYGVDGETYQFFVRPNLFGKTWSPDDGDAKLLVDVGKILVDFAQSDESSNGSDHKEFSKLLKSIRQRTDRE